MSGWWSLGKISGVPVRVHWSALLGALFCGGFAFAPGAWIGFLVVVIVHELGHAAVVQFTGNFVQRVDVHVLGGECRWGGLPTALERATIAWGGVWAQLALFVVAMPVSLLVGDALGSFGRDLFAALTWESMILAALNLVPFPPLDGAEAWKLPGLARSWWRRRR